MKYLGLESKSLLLCSLLLLAACGGSGGGGEKSSDPDVAAAALGSKISIEGGNYKEGPPPPADLLYKESNPDGGSITPGNSGQLSMDIDDATWDLNSNDAIAVNVAFTGAGSPVSSAKGFTTISTTAGSVQNNNGMFTPNFSVPSDVCNNLTDIQHQIDCYESVTLPDGTVVSSDQAKQMVLACDTGNFNGGDFSGPGSFCAYNYPYDACEIIQQDYPQTAFTPGEGSGTCSGYPNVETSYDYGYSNNDGLGQVGACVVAF